MCWIAAEVNTIKLLLHFLVSATNKLSVYSFLIDEANDIRIYILPPSQVLQEYISTLAQSTRKKCMYILTM